MEKVRRESDVAAHMGRSKGGVEWAAGREQIRAAKSRLFQIDVHMAQRRNARQEAGLLSVSG